MHVSSLIKYALALNLGWKYVDAKFHIGEDLSTTRSLVNAFRQISRRTAQDQLNVWYVLEQHALATPDKICLIYKNEKFTYRAVYEYSLRYANFFLSNNIKKSNVVALNFTNKPSFVFAFYGLFAIGATPAFINYNLEDKALVHCYLVSTASFFLIDEEVAQRTEAILASLPSEKKFSFWVYGNTTFPWARLLTDAFLKSYPLTRPDDTLRHVNEASDTALLIYTSGSTGLPKPAIVSWTKANAGIIMTSGMSQVTQDDIFYSCMPIYHATAAVLGVIARNLLGATYVIGHKFSNKTFWPEVVQSKATVIQYVGETCRYLLAAPLSELDKAHCVRMAAGNGMRPDVWMKFRERFNIRVISEFYAATESNGGLFNRNTGDYGVGAIGSTGALLNLVMGGRMAIVKVDPISEDYVRGTNGLCVSCKAGEVGEALFKLDATQIKVAYQGYFNNKTASDKKIIRDVLVKGDAYFRSGDLMHKDSDHLLYFDDRIGDTYRWKGENVSTMEVAAALGELPGVDEANVYGVELPQHDGRAGCAAIYSTSKLPTSKIAAHVKRRLPVYARPLFIRVTNQMYTTGNNKQQKTLLRSQGVDPSKVDTGDTLLWLQGDDYVQFNKWDDLKKGLIKL